jgi:hypothetical protein
MAGSELLRPSDATKVASQLLGVAMGILWIWWALADGAFFATVMLPGSLLLLAAIGIVLAYAPIPLARRGPHALAILSLTALAAWCAISIIWSPAPDQALENAQRAFIYVAAYGAGLLLAMTMRRRLLVAVLPLLAAGAAAAVLVVARILLADTAEALVDAEGTLAFPFGYRNANAGFFVVIALASLAVLARPRNDPLLRAGAGGLAAGALSLAAISQSRGSLLALAFGALVLLAASPSRARTLLGGALVAIPVALVFAELLGPYDAAGAQQPVLPELQSAAVAAIAAAAAAALLCALWAIVERRSPAAARMPLPSRRTGLLLTLGAGIVAVGAAIALAGNPVDWFDDDSVAGAETEADEAASGSRFTYSGGLNRGDFWRVALDQAADAPLIGDGAGSFRSAYLLERETYEAPRDAHSLPLEMLGELGIVGLALLALFLAGAVGAALRSRYLGPEAGFLSAAALGAGGAWFAQACVDWSWAFAGLTAPVIALLGSAGATAALSLGPLNRRVRRGGIALACVLGLIALPTFASARLTFNAAEGWRTDLDGAYSALDDAAALNPLSDQPYLVKAEIARQNDEPELAYEALLDARERQPDEFQNYLTAAEVLAEEDERLALEEVERALELNPRSKRGLALRDQLESDPSRG